MVSKTGVNRGSLSERKTSHNHNHHHSSNFWNRDLLEFIAQRLGTPQLPYIHGQSITDVSESQPTNYNDARQNDDAKTNAAGEGRDAKTNQGVLNIGEIPEHFANRLRTVSSDIVDNLYILKVNTKNSLLHSILGLLDESYRISPWEKKEYMVSLFRGKISSDMERNKDLNDRLKHTKISKASIQKDMQERYPTDLIKSFISVYFGVNLIIVSDKIETVPKTIDKYAPCLLLYQYPFGNVAPIIQGHADQGVIGSDQTLILSKSPILQALFGESIMEKPKEKPTVEKTIEMKPAKDLITVDHSNSEKEKKEKELLKLSLSEIQILCASHGIETKKPASKKDTFKNLTKKELVELLSDKYTTF